MNRKSIKYTDKSGEYGLGGIGLATYNAEAFVDNIKVEDPDIPGAGVDSAGKITTMWKLYSGLFILLKRKITLAKDDLLQALESAYMIFRRIVFGNVRTLV